MASFVYAVVSNALLALLLAVVVFAVCRLRRIRLTPALAHVLWLLVLAKMVTPPLVGLPLLPASQSEDVIASSLVAADTLPNGARSGAQARRPIVSDERSAVKNRAGSSQESSSAAELPRAIDRSTEATSLLKSVVWPELAVAWLLGTFAFLVVGLRQIRRLGQLLPRAVPAEGGLQAVAKRIAVELGLRRRPEIRVVHAPVAPLLWVTPRRLLIVVPQSFLASLDERQRENVIAHELAHYARGDHWTNTFCFLTAVLFWWHPVIWWARREIQMAQELCCDAIVLNRYPGRKRQYAETLLQAVDFVSQERPLLPQLASGFGRVTSLKRRFEMLMHPQLNHRLSRWAYPLLLGIAVLLPCTLVRGLAADRPASEAREGERKEGERKEGDRERGDREGERREGDRREGDRREEARGDRERGEREGERREGERREGDRREEPRGDREGERREGERREGDRREEARGDREGERREGDRREGDRREEARGEREGERREGERREGDRREEARGNREGERREGDRREGDRREEARGDRERGEREGERREGERREGDRKEGEARPRVVDGHVVEGERKEGERRAGDREGERREKDRREGDRREEARGDRERGEREGDHREEAREKGGDDDREEAAEARPDDDEEEKEVREDGSPRDDEEDDEAEDNEKEDSE